MRKLLLIALVIGMIIPLFAQTKEFYYVSLLFGASLIFFSIKKWSISIIDMLVIFLITIPLHTFRLGGTEHFVRLSEIAFIPLFLWWLTQFFLKNPDRPFTIRKEFLFLFAYLAINIL